MSLSHVMIVWTLVAVATAQSHCDPTTQYEKEGRCCLKCGPGTRMLSSSSCEEPQCKECGEREYQEKYTTSTQCESQDYCDPNKNFKWRTDDNKKKRIPCLCEDGFHCSSKECFTCVPHKSCPPGSGARSIGNHSHDTVCEKCPDGKFSSNNSWNEVCQKWKVCKEGFHESRKGTGETDIECEEAKSVTPLVVGILVIVAIIIVVLGFIWYKIKSKKEYKNVAQPTDPESSQEEKILEIQTDTDEIVPSIPEENEDDLSVLEQGFTSKGKVVTQEMGKTNSNSLEESQIETIQRF